MKSRQAGLAFIFVTLLLDVLGIGIVIPILPELIAGGGWVRWDDAGGLQYQCAAQLVVLVGTSTLLRAGHAVAGWIGWLGYTAAALGLLSLEVMLQSDLIFLGIVSAMLYKVWMIVVSVALLRGPRAVCHAAPREFAV